MKHDQYHTNQENNFQRHNGNQTTRKHQPFPKTFHKKYQANGLPVSSPIKPNNQLNKSKSKSQHKSNQNSHGNINILIQEQTFARNVVSKNRPQSPNPAARGRKSYEQTKLELSLQKLQNIVSILCTKIGNEPSQIVQNLHNKNGQYLQLLHSWQKLQVYDEIDKNIYKITQHYLEVIGVLINSIYIQLDYKLEKYQSVMQQLEIQSAQLLKYNNELEQMLSHSNIFKIGQKTYFQQKIKELDQKNQFATVLLTEMQKNNFDLQTFSQIMIIPTKHYLQTQIIASQKASGENIMPLRHTQSQIMGFSNDNTMAFDQKRWTVNQKRSSN